VEPFDDPSNAFPDGPRSQPCQLTRRCAGALRNRPLEDLRDQPQRRLTHRGGRSHSRCGRGRHTILKQMCQLFHWQGFTQNDFRRLPGPPGRHRILGPPGPSPRAPSPGPTPQRSQPLENSRLLASLRVFLCQGRTDWASWGFPYPSPPSLPPPLGEEILIYDCES